MNNSREQGCTEHRFSARMYMTRVGSASTTIDATTTELDATTAKLDATAAELACKEHR